MSDDPKDVKPKNAEHNSANDSASDSTSDSAGSGNAGMNILKKIIATIRTESRELKEAVMDAGGSGKIELAYESAQFKLNEAKAELNDMLRKERQAERVLEIVEDEIKKIEVQVAKALLQGDESEAMNHAMVVVDLEKDKEGHTASKLSITSNVEYLQRQLEQSERELKSIGRQLSMLKTTEKVQQATETIMGNIEGADEKMMSAKQSLNHIREQQKNKSNLHTTEEQMVKDYQKGKAADQALKNAKNSAEKVIKRIQEKSSDAIESTVDDNDGDKS